MAMETNASGDDNGRKEAQGNERQHDKSRICTSCIGIRYRFASAVYRTMENSRIRTIVSSTGAATPPLRMSWLCGNNEVARRGVGSLPRNRARSQIEREEVESHERSHRRMAGTLKKNASVRRTYGRHEGRGIRQPRYVGRTVARSRMQSVPEFRGKHEIRGTRCFPASPFPAAFYRRLFYILSREELRVYRGNQYPAHEKFPLVVLVVVVVVVRANRSTPGTHV